MRTRTLSVVVMGALIAGSAIANGSSSEECGKTLSPYFFVKSDDAEVDQLPLKSTSAKVKIAGVIADVTVTQVYANEGKTPLEATYVFPASTRAAVYGMTMFVGDRKIVARIKERKKAKQIYEKAKQEGKSTSLLQQRRPNVFEMNVANIMPGDEIRIELKYTELLVPVDSVYEFAYPTVVGPRYSNVKEEAAPPSENWVKSPYLKEKESPTYTFDIGVTISAGMPIQDVSCISHKVNVVYPEPSLSTVALDRTEGYGGNRDYILRYRLAGKSVESGILLYEGPKEDFFLLMVQPPRRLIPAEIPGRDYLFIVDVSGSMSGFPLNTSKELLRDLLSHLRPTDTFNVLLFAGGSQVMSDKPVPATKENIDRAIKVLDNQRGGGATALLPALKRALALPKEENKSRTIVIATDGYVTVEAETFDLMRNNLGKANMFAFGIGSGVNRYIIEGMARIGMGEPFVVTDKNEAQAKARKFRDYIASPVLTGITIDYDGFDVYDVEPLSIPDVFADRPIVVFGKWCGTPNGAIKVKGITGSAPYVKRIEVDGTTPNEANSALRYLWARHRIAMLCDYGKLGRNAETVREVTNLGLTYNLLTPYTSFVAVDEVVRNTNKSLKNVKQPLPLPKGVSNNAIGGGSVPEPGTWALLTVTAGLLGRTLRQRRKKKTSE